jgi:Lrp/AsnC family transcriptional regulator, leucine-responsive regulatory protein
MMDTFGELDRLDLKILTELVQEGRISWRELSEKIGLSLTPTLRRVRLLEDAGFIKGYSAHLDEARLAGAISVVVAVSLEKQSQESLDAFEREIVVAPQVMSCFQMTGDADYILRVVVASLDEYQFFLSGVLSRIKGVAHIKSSFALKTVLNRQAPVLPVANRQKRR